MTQLNQLPVNDSPTDLHSGDCSHCAVCGASDEHEPEQPEEKPPLTGIWFAIAALGAFILPLALAIAGSIYGGDDGLHQLLGGLGGFLLGVILALPIVKISHSLSKKSNA